ncbi:hypothetical protein DENSPDRAFT_318346 [Dentipellis sp. KUC8613]|nr:hypothetical protein DENSPDRAFT_318346 [Dentipellis sp. KUC8613]
MVSLTPQDHSISFVNEKGEVQCFHGMPAVWFQSKKERSFNRFFWTCAYEGAYHPDEPQRCRFWKWDDELPPHEPPKDAQTGKPLVEHNPSQQLFQPASQSPHVLSQNALLSSQPSQPPQPSSYPVPPKTPPRKRTYEPNTTTPSPAPKRPHGASASSSTSTSTITSPARPIPANPMTPAQRSAARDRRIKILLEEERRRLTPSSSVPTTDPVPPASVPVSPSAAKSTTAPAPAPATAPAPSPHPSPSQLDNHYGTPDSPSVRRAYRDMFGLSQEAFHSDPDDPAHDAEVYRLLDGAGATQRGNSQSQASVGATPLASNGSARLGSDLRSEESFFMDDGVGRVPGRVRVPVDVVGTNPSQLTHEEFQYSSAEKGKQRADEEGVSVSGSSTRGLEQSGPNEPVTPESVANAVEWFGLVLPDLIRKQERQKAALQRSNDAKALHIKRLEAEIGRYVSVVILLALLPRFMLI